eukprot:scaffold4095_cov63-Phaeocystis_antarctica.AAC.1
MSPSSAVAAGRGLVSAAGSHPIGHLGGMPSRWFMDASSDRDSVSGLRRLSSRQAACTALVLTAAISKLSRVRFGQPAMSLLICLPRTFSQ